MSVDDCWLRFVKEGQASKSLASESSQDQLPEVKKRGGIETGKHVLTDPKWSKVNSVAHSRWSGFFGGMAAKAKQQKKENK